MPIEIGQDAKPSDFISESERQATKADDEGRVPKLEADGFLSRSFLRDTSVRLTLSGNAQLAGISADYAAIWDTETFDTAGMHGAIGEANAYSDATAVGTSTIASNTAWRAQEFTTGAGLALLKKATLSLRSDDGSSETVVCAIRASLTGPDLVTSAAVGFGNTSYETKTFVFPQYLLDPNTTYYLVFRTSGGHGGGNDVLFQTNTGGTGASTSADTGASWSPAAYSVVGTVVTDDQPAVIIPADGRYLVIANINSGVGVDKTIKIKKGNSTLLTWVADSDGTVEASANLQTVLSLEEDDVLYLTVNQASSASDDILAAGSTFEIIRI